MADSFKVACVQVNSGNDIAENIAAVTPLIRSAAKDGARLITTPECVTMMEDGRENVLAKALAEKDHPALPAFS
ncbi:MAG: carbon-nitrogen hydrolase family protein, partial [Rhodospirillaceae bacterium]|nr:carbon-nitrogen hydrolase family protein [Rhodospirillaceae bacterium]